MICTAALAARAATSRALCGSELWSLKTLSDPQRKLVVLRPRTTTIRAINTLRAPSFLSTRRYPFERRVWRVVAEIVEYKLEADDDIHLVLSEGGSRMIAEMPAAACLPATTRDRRAIVDVRTLFESRCGAPADFWRPLGPAAWISGVGFRDFPHGQRGHAANYAELHPVTGLRPIAGCGA
jgi:hypothetical protein